MLDESPKDEEAPLVDVVSHTVDPRKGVNVALAALCPVKKLNFIQLPRVFFYVILLDAFRGSIFHLA